MEFDFVCHLKGHEVLNTINIEESGEFYEVFDAKLCSRCGRILSDNQTEKSVLDSLQKYIHLF